MTRLEKMFMTAVLGCAALASPAWSQAGGAADCGAALNKDILSILRTDHQQYAYLNRIDRETFTHLKSGGGGGLNIPIVSGLIGASASFEDFQRRRDQFFQEIRYNASREYEERVLSIVTNPIAYAEWGQCMETFARNRIGFHAWKTADRADVMVVSYRWTSPPDARRVRAVTEVIGGRVNGAPEGQAFPYNKRYVTNEEGVVTIRRSEGASTLMATIGADGYNTTPIFSSYEEQVEPLGVAFMRVTGQAEHLVQTDLTTSGTSADNHDKRCPRNGTPCDGSGVWRASILTLSLDAGEGRVLRGVRLSCDGIPPQIRRQINQMPNTGMFRGVRARMLAQWKNVCAYMKVETPPIEGQRTAVIQVKTWTRPTLFTLHADVHEPRPAGAEELGHTSIYGGQTFAVKDHSAVPNRVVVARACGGESPASPGQNSPDGRLRFVGQAGLGTEAMLVYEYTAPVDGRGRPIAACRGVNAVQASAALQKSIAP
jgi:hypothetical protein